jgi:hypothetical protein
LKTFKKLISLTTTGALLIATHGAFASIPNRTTNLDLSIVKPVHPINNSLFTAENIKKFCPEMTPTTDSMGLAVQIETGLEKKFENYLLKEAFMEQKTIKAINSKVEKVTKASLTLPSVGAHNKIVHKVNFNLRAVEREATAGYEGYFTATSTFRILTNDVVYVISKPINSSTDLALTNVSPMGQFTSTGNLQLTHRF